MCLRSLIIVGCLCALGCGDGSEHQSMSKKSAKPRKNHAQMIWVEGGSFDMGAFESDLEALPREKPRHRVKVSGFYMDVHEVTNAQFSEFVTATGYVTVAEREVKTADGVFEPGSMVFESPTDVFGLRDHGQWWRWRKSASWRCPEGAGSTWEKFPTHPVVHVAFEDAVAYAKWRNCRLPTEAEWEYAATSRGNAFRFPWGNEPPEVGEAKCNIWEGVFPTSNHAQDGYVGSAPVKTFSPNSLGLWDLGGNVWELCEDWYSPGRMRLRIEVKNRTIQEGPWSRLTPWSQLCRKRSCVEGRFCATKGIARATGSQLACQLLTTQERVTLVFVVFALSTIL